VEKRNATYQMKPSAMSSGWKSAMNDSSFPLRQ
jgi:hypothetical protein